MSIWITWTPAKVEFLLTHVTLSCKWRRNETNPENEGPLDQHRLRATCITTDAIGSLTGVKLIGRLHYVFDLHFRVREKPQAATYELKIRVKPCHIR